MPIKSWLFDEMADAVDFVRRRHLLALHRRDIRAGRLILGKHTYGLPQIHRYEGSEARVIIGDYCSISRGVVFITGGIHPTDWVSTFPFRVMWELPGKLEDGIPTTKGDIVVGPDVWIGTDTVVMSGVTVGPGAILCARSVVTRDVPPYAIVGGVPAKPIKARFPAEVAEKLLSLKWWDWPEEKVREAIPLLSSNRMNEFLQRYGER